MINRFIISAVFIFVGISGFSQFGYKNQLDAVTGIEIKYKLVHAKTFDKESPVELRLKLKNTNDFNANVKFEIEYNLGFTKKFTSGEIEICIPKKSAKTGKMHGLVFETNSNDLNIFSTDEAEWHFIKFDVAPIDDCNIKLN